MIKSNGEIQQTVTASNTIIKVVTIVAVAVVGVLMVKFIGSSCAGEPTPYDINNSESFGVSVKYDANGGTFTTNTSVIVDSFNVDEMSADGEGNVNIALIAPDNSIRGNDAFTPVKNGYFLAGWYAKRDESIDSDGNVVYTYADKWDFDKDKLTVDKDKSYDAENPVITLYAAWVPMFEIQLYAIETGEYIDSLVFDPTSMDTIEMPAWDEEEGIMEMYDFPERDGYTFEQAYYDAEGKQAVESEFIEHKGSVDYETGTAVDNVMKLYVEWTEGEWYHIYTAEQFVDNANVNGCYEIYADLDFSDENWPSTFMYGNFTGTINGNGYTFKNVEFAQTNNDKVNAGLFGNITETANISDLTFENVVFTIEAGTRVADTRYGLFAGKVADGAKVTNVKIKESKLQIDSASYFANDSYIIGLVCAEGNPEITADISCISVGENPKNLKISVSDEGIVTLVFITE